MKNQKKSAKRIALITSGVIAVIALAGGAVKAVSVYEKKNALDQMKAIITERVQLIKNFASSAEQTLQHYSSAAQITELLADPKNKELAEKAQKFTEEYSEDIESLEGIYAASYETLILTHTNSSVVGIVTRADLDTRKALYETMLSAGEDVYDAGIVLSPASGKTCFIMYKAIFNENGDLLGYTGLNSYPDTLVNKQSIPYVKGVENASFSFIDVKNVKCVYHPDKELLGKTIETDKIVSLCDELSQKTDSADGTIEYQDDSGKHIAAYSYMPEYNVLLMFEANI